MKGTAIVAVLLIALLVLVPLSFAKADDIPAEWPGKGTGEGPATDYPNAPTTEDIDDENTQDFLTKKEYREQIRAQVQTCLAEGTENAECQQIRARANKISGNVLEHVCARYEYKIEAFRGKVENAQKLTPEEKEQLMEVIDAERERLNELCESIDDSDTEELKETIREMRTLMNGINSRIRLAKQLIVLNRGQTVVKRSEMLVVKLERMTEIFGQDCGEEAQAELETLTEEFNSQIEEASGLYDESRALWGEFRDSIQNDKPDTEKLREAQAKMQEGQKTLQDAHVTLKKIVVVLKSCRGIVPGENETEENETEEEEPEEPEEPENETEENETNQSDLT